LFCIYDFVSFKLIAHSSQLTAHSSMEMGYIIRVGRAKAIFLSADKTANVVGNTAHLLLEVD